MKIPINFFLKLAIAISIFQNTALAHTSHFKKVITIVFENESTTAVLKVPFFKSLLKSGAFLSDFSAVGRPSQPNYLAMIAGSTFGLDHDNNVVYKEKTIVDLLEKKGKSWKAYAEDYPGNCFTGGSFGPYVRKHVPFLSFSNITSKPSRCSKIVEMNSFFDDFKKNKLPHYSFITPNIKNDGHDTSVEFAASWFEKNFSKILNDSKNLKDTLFIVTFDEGSWRGNDVYTLLLGGAIKPGSKNKTNFTHYSVLKLIEDEFELGNLGLSDKSATAINDIWL